MTQPDLNNVAWFLMGDLLRLSLWNRSLGLPVGMAIFTRSAGIRSGPTLMGRILPNPIRNRVGFGFLKKTRTRSRSGTGFCKPPTRTRPVSNIIKKKKILGINTTLSLQKIISLTLISQLSAAPLSPSLAVAGPSSISPISSVPASLIELLTHPPHHRDR